MIKGHYYLVLYILVCLLLSGGCASPQKPLASAVPLQQYEFPDVEKLMAEQERPIAIFIQAEWCKFCRNMEQTTLKNKRVINWLNDAYYFISFDGEHKEEVVFNEHVFGYQPTGRNTGIHELAKALGSIEGELTFPAFIILNPKYEIVFQYNAFLTARAMADILEKGVVN